MRVVEVLIIFALAAGCSREFSAPPPYPSIEAFDPDRGYMGDRVEILGENFDGDPEDNLVFFGTSSAAVIEASGERLLVEVPSLEAGEQAYLKVSTPVGQDSSEDPFVCLGPGHPLEEKPGIPIDIEWAPLAVTSTRVSSEPGTEALLAVASITGRTASLLSTNGVHYDFGVRDMPMSIAMLRVGAAVRRAYLTTVSVGAGEQIELNSDFMTLEVAFADSSPFPVIVPASQIDLPQIEGVRLQPHRVWAYCTDSVLGICQKPLVVASDLTRPVLYLLDRGGGFLGDRVKLLGSLLTSPPVADLRYFAELDSFVVALDGPEIYLLPASWDEAAAPLWPPDGYDGPDLGHIAALEIYPVFDPANGALANSFVYVADRDNQSLVEFELETSTGSPVLTRRREAHLFGAPYALQIAQPDAASSFLFVACEDGILVFDPVTDASSGNSGVIPFVNLVPLPFSRGGPQSLARVRAVDFSNPDDFADTLVFADTVRDVVRLIPLGFGTGESIELPLGYSVPQLATSRFSDTLLLADPMANMIRVIDRKSGVQSDQFPILDERSFGAYDVLYQDTADRDVLLIPLPGSQLFEQAERMLYTRIVVRRADSQEDIREWISADDQTSLDDSGIFEQDSESKRFHEMLPAPRTNSLYLVRYGYESLGLQGDVRVMAFCPGAQDLDGVLRESGSGDCQPAFSLDPIGLSASARLVRISPSEDLLVALEDRCAGLKAGVRVIDLASREDLCVPVEKWIFDLAGDLAIRASPQADAGGDGSPSAYLTLPALGQVAVLYQDGTLHMIETTGVPARFFLSPDQRRLYVTHQAEGKLSIIDVSCDQPGCESLTGNLDIPPYPSEVSFHPSGKNAFVTHYLSNLISVIE